MLHHFSHSDCIVSLKLWQQSENSPPTLFLFHTLLLTSKIFLVVFGHLLFFLKKFFQLQLTSVLFLCSRNHLFFRISYNASYKAFPIITIKKCFLPLAYVLQEKFLSALTTKKCYNFSQELTFFHRYQNQEVSLYNKKAQVKVFKYSIQLKVGAQLMIYFILSLIPFPQSFVQFAFLPSCHSMNLYQLSKFIPVTRQDINKFSKHKM